MVFVKLLVSPMPHERAPMLAPDGRANAYVSNVSGADRIYLQRYPDGGRAQPIFGDGATAPTWSRDGRELFFVADGHLMAVEVDLSERALAPVRPVNSSLLASAPRRTSRGTRYTTLPRTDASSSCVPPPVRAPGASSRTGAQSRSRCLARSGSGSAGSRGDSDQQRKDGGPEGVRTPDLVNAIHARSQLRHWPIDSYCMLAFAFQSIDGLSAQYSLNIR